MSTPRLATALWIHTRTSMEQIRQALRTLPVVSESAGNGFVHLLYDEARWTAGGGADRVAPMHSVRELLDQAQLPYVVAIGREIPPIAVAPSGALTLRS